jgi:transposase
MRPPKKLQVFANFWPPPPKKKVTTLYHPPYSPDLSPPDYFLFPKLKITLKGLQFADELKNVKKEEFSAAFQKLYDRAKACIYVNGAYFEQKKNVCVFLMCLQFFKKNQS